VLSFSGEARTGEDTDLEAAPADREALSRLDRAAYGFDRAADHAMWRSSGDATLWLRADEPVGYSYVWPAGTIGPVAGADPEAAGAAARAELARREGLPAQIRVPGSAAPIVAAALAAGLRIGGSPGLLLVSQPHRPPDALAIGSYTLL
jgi:hypothetical protein